MPHIVIGNGTTATTTQIPGFGFDVIVAQGGTIATTDADGILAQGSNNIIVSGEVISGGGGNPIQVDGALVNIAVAPTGKLIGYDGFFGIFVNTAANVLVNNAGLIRSETVFGPGSAVVFSVGSDRFINSGTIEGNVSLSGGNDTFEHNGGDVRGQSWVSPAKTP